MRLRLSEDPRWRFAEVCGNCGEKIVNAGADVGRWHWRHLDSNRQECWPPLVAIPKQAANEPLSVAVNRLVIQWGVAPVLSEVLLQGGMRAEIVNAFLSGTSDEHPIQT